MRAIKGLIKNTNNEVYDDAFALQVRDAIYSIMPGDLELVLLCQRQIGLNRVEVAAAFARLNSAISQYNEQQDSTTQFESFKTVLRRFLLEYQQVRGEEFIFTDANRVLEFLCANPKYMEMAEEVAQHHTAACINQPMTGWFIIYSLVAIGRAQTVTDKVEAAKISLIIAEIIEFIKKDTSPDKPHSDLEVEAINSMIAMFCKKALEEGAANGEVWPKVQAVLHQDMIAAEWLQRSFATFYERAGLKILQSREYESLLSVILIGDRGTIFFSTAFPEMKRALEAEVEAEKAELQSFAALLFSKDEGFSFNYEDLLRAVKEEEIFEESELEKQEAFAHKYQGVTQEASQTLFEEASFAVKITKDGFIKELTKRCMERILMENPNPQLTGHVAPDSAGAVVVAGSARGQDCV